MASTAAPRARSARTAAPSRVAPESADRKYHHGDLPGALLHAVGELVRERGAAAVSMREAARRANVSHGAPGHHFQSKQGMLTAFAAAGFRQLESDVRDAQAALGATAGGPERLAASGEAYARFAFAHPEQFALMFRPDQVDGGNAALGAASEAAFGAMREAVDACVKEGRVARRDAERTGIAAWALAHGLSELWLSGRIVERTSERDPGALATFVTRRFVEALLGVELPAARKRKAKG